MSLVDSFEKLLRHLNAEENEMAIELLEELKQADKDLNWLDCLRGAGVDNWSGIDYAYVLLEEEEVPQ